MKMKKTYQSPVTELVAMRARVSILTTSQTDWADAKHNDQPSNIWNDDADAGQEDDTNWAGYHKDMNLW